VGECTNIAGGEIAAPVCTAEQIAAPHHVGLRIVWADDGERVT
jgi:hypothetical protein